MRRTTLNFVVDLIAFTNLLLLMATGAIMKWVLPPGSGGGSGGHGYGFRGKTCAKSVFFPSRKIPCDRAGEPDA